MTLILALVVLSFMAINGPDVAEAFRIVIECSQPQCTQTCQNAYKEKLISAFCKKTDYGNLCVCVHKP